MRIARVRTGTVWPSVVPGGRLDAVLDDGVIRIWRLFLTKDVAASAVAYTSRPRAKRVKLWCGGFSRVSFSPDRTTHRESMKGLNKAVGFTPIRSP